jgi:dihydroorotase (multifunctional complex type)
LSDFDIAILGGTLVLPSGRLQQHLYIRDGRVAAVTCERHSAVTEVDAKDLCVLPGMVDTHVHLMDPGDPTREDFPTGTGAAAAAGVTSIVEHTHAQPIRSVGELKEKLGHLQGRANVDFGLAAHVWPDHLESLADLWLAGITFFKIFTCTTHGVPGLDAARLHQALQATAEFGGVCLVHCEDESLTQQAEARLKAAHRRDPAVIPAWRSREAELVATSVTCLLAELTGARVSIAHVSNPAVADIVAHHRARGASLAAEACPQYFLLREQEILEHGGFRKFTPPARARSGSDENAMWKLLSGGVLTYVSSDHAPATAQQKVGGDIWDVHFGLPGIDTTLPLLLDAALSGRLALEDVVRRYAEMPAQWYGLYPRKGTFAVGADADVVLIDPEGRRKITDASVISKAGWSPYAGRELRGRVVSVRLRGETIAEAGKPVGATMGQFLHGAGAAK